MAFSNSYAFDIKDVKIQKITAEVAGDPGTYTLAAAIDFAASQLLTLDEEEGDTVELRGDGAVVASSRTKGAGTFEMRGGGIAADALGTLFDWTVVETGSGSTLVRTIRPKETADPPFFKLSGQSLNSDGGDTKVVLWKAKVLPRDLPPVSLEEGAFVDITVTGTYTWTNSAPEGVGTGKRKFSILQRATAAASADL